MDKDSNNFDALEKCILKSVRYHRTLGANMADILSHLPNAAVPVVGQTLDSKLHRMVEEDKLEYHNGFYHLNKSGEKEKPSKSSKKGKKVSETPKKASKASKNRSTPKIEGKLVKCKICNKQHNCVQTAKKADKTMKKTFRRECIPKPKLDTRLRSCIQCYKRHVCQKSPSQKKVSTTYKNTSGTRKSSASSERLSRTRKSSVSKKRPSRTRKSSASLERPSRTLKRKRSTSPKQSSGTSKSKISISPKRSGQYSGSNSVVCSECNIEHNCIERQKPEKKVKQRTFQRNCKQKDKLDTRMKKCKKCSHEHVCFKHEKKK